jgi:hypothetical protein
MTKETLFEIDPQFEVENQVDAMFVPLFSLIPATHHTAIVNVERDMINAIKSALRLPATEPLSPNPATWPFSAGDRLRPFLSSEQKEMSEAKKCREPN